MNELAMLGQLKSRGLFCKVSLVPFPHSVRRVVVSDVHVFFYILVIEKSSQVVGTTLLVSYVVE